MSRTLLVMAGGTGGHVMPGLAVAETLRGCAWQVVWLGNPQGMEARLVPRHGIVLEGIQMVGVRGKGLMTALRLPFSLLRACWQSMKVLRRVRPSVVLGMGGYVAFPGGVMASLLGYPLVVHEQNSVAGLTNRVLARLADRVLEAFPKALPGAIWTGNPVRSDMLDTPLPQARYAARSGRLRVLVVGGSLGASALNKVLPEAIALLGADERPIVRHQSGAAHLDSLTGHYQRLGVEAEVLPFIDDMASAYTEADLVICRSGAMTVAELAAVGVASILVPLPHAVDDHQTGNARFLADQGAATLMAQSALDAPTLAGLLRAADRRTLTQQAVRARALARPDAAQAVADICQSLAQERGR